LQLITAACKGAPQRKPARTGSQALDLFDLPRCSEAERNAAPQFSLAPPDPESVIEWVPGVSLTAKREIWLPLTCIYLGLPFPLSSHLSSPVSTGFAAGEDYNQAIRAGLLEVIERDSLALWWIAQSPFPRLKEPFSAHPEMAPLLSALADRGIEHTCSI
jgi:ribosomal protein S12 methylthiotransferase accessory factor